MQNRMQEMMHRQAALKQKYGDLRLEKLKNTVFHKGQYSLTWLQAAVDALQYTTPVSLKLPVNEFVELCNIEISTEEEISFMEAGMLLNNFEMQSAHTLGLSMDDYLALLEENDTIAKKWNAHVKKWTDKIDEEMEKELTDLAKLQNDNMAKTMAAVPKAEA